MHDTLRTSSRILAAGAALMLAGCNWFGGESKEAAREEDPATTEALGDQIMYDPDLAGQNRADSAAFVPSGDGSIPTVEGGTEAIAAARADALRLVGGPGKMQKAPTPREVAGALPANAALTAAARAAAARGVTAIAPRARSTPCSGRQSCRRRSRFIRAGRCRRRRGPTPRAARCG